MKMSLKAYKILTEPFQNGQSFERGKISPNLVTLLMSDIVILIEAVNSTLKSSTYYEFEAIRTVIICPTTKTQVKALCF